MFKQQGVVLDNSCKYSVAVLIDCVDDEDFGKLYRVWEQSQLIGTYYKSLTGKWHSQISNLGGFIPCDNSEIAVNKIIERRV